MPVEGRERQNFAFSTDTRTTHGGGKSGTSVIVRYADDALFFFKSKEKASRLYHLKLNKDKTRLIDFRRGQNTSFDFLGFTFYWEAIKSLFKWMNRRSQKRSFNWDVFHRKLEYNNVPKPPEIHKIKSLGWNPYAI